MYKLLLVSDKEEVLSAFEQIQNWEYNGFRKPHVRRDLEGARQSLQIHHADAIVMKLSPEKERELMIWLREANPLLPVCEAGETVEKALAYLGELNRLLNRIRADFSSNSGSQQDAMIRCRRHFFRKLVGEHAMTCQELRRGMRMRRSRMNPDLPCVLMTLEHGEIEDSVLQDEDHQLEKSLFRSFGGDVEGFHVLPLVTRDGRIFVLAGALYGRDNDHTAEEVTAVLKRCVSDGIRHAEEYQGLHLRVTGIDVLPSLYALCPDYQGSLR